MKKFLYIPVIILNFCYVQGQSIADLKFSVKISADLFEKSFQFEKRSVSPKKFPPEKFVKTELILSPIIGGLLPMNEFKGDLSDVSLHNASTSSRAYYEKYGYFVGFTAKLPLGKQRNFRPKITAVYNWFLNSGSDSSGAYTIEPSINIFQIGLGAEYVFLKAGNFMPYVEVDLMANIFSGSIAFTNNETSLGFSLNYNRNVRYGVSGGAGLEYSINKNYSLLGGVKYNIANLVGREYDATGAHDLNDAAFSINGFNIDQKTISFISIYFGASLNIRD